MELILCMPQMLPLPWSWQQASILVPAQLLHLLSIYAISGNSDFWQTLMLTTDAAHVHNTFLLWYILFRADSCQLILLDGLLAAIL